MATIFSRIVSGEIPCYKIAETDDYLAFLDVMPRVWGHALVIPKKEVDFIFDLSDDELSGLMLFAKKVGNVVKAVVPAKRVTLAVVGLEVPHTHIHIKPIQEMAEFGFNSKPKTFPNEMMKDLAQKLADKYNEMYPQS